MKNVNRSFLILILAIVFVLFTTVGYTQPQSYCGVPMNNAEPMGLLPTGDGYQERYNNSTGPYYIKVYVHAIRHLDYTGGQTEAAIDNAFAMLANHFNPHNIFFVRSCETIPIPVIEDDYADWYIYMDLFADPQYQYPDGLSMFFGPDEVTNQIGGVVPNIPSTALWVAGTWEPFYSFIPTMPVAQSPILSHEMGHCLGLHHTFHGTALAEGDSNSCCELANGANSTDEDCGDYVADTNADPFLWHIIPTPTDFCGFLHFDDCSTDPTTLSSCFWPETEPGDCPPRRDANYIPYNPPSNNFMSYNDILQCRTEFTTGQGERMRNMIEITPALQMTLVPPPEVEIYVSPIDMFCVDGTPELVYSICPPSDCPSANPVDVTLVPTVLPASVAQYFTFGGVFSDGSEVVTIGPGCTEIVLYLTISSSIPIGTEFQIQLVATPENLDCPKYLESENIVTGVAEDCTVTLCSCPNGGIQIGALGQTTVLSENLSSIPNPLTGCVVIAGHFIIDQGLFNISAADAHIEPGARITVGSEDANNNPVNATLRIRSGSHLHGCPDMWQGITTKTASTLLIGENSVIEDAHVAAFAEANATVQVNNTIFRRNKIGIASESGFFLNGMNDVTFECLTDLSPPLSGQYAEAGMKVVGGTYTVGVAGGTKNRFENLNNGIIATWSNLIVQNTEFFDIHQQGTESYSLSGYGIYSKIPNPFFGSSYFLEQVGLGKDGDLSFDDCRVGIYGHNLYFKVSDNHMANMTQGIISEWATPSDNGPSLDIKNNNITASERGIVSSFALHYSTKFIKDNDVTLTGSGVGIEVNGPDIPVDVAKLTRVENNVVDVNTSGPARGIQVNSGVYVNLVNNLVDLTNSGTGDIAGIQVSNSSRGVLECNEVVEGAVTTKGIWGFMSPSTTWSCNKVSDMGTGFQFDGDCFSMQNFRGNIMEDNKVGLKMKSGSALGSQSVRGNTWLGAFSQTQGAARHDGDFDNVSESLFEAEQNSNFFPNPIVFLDPLMEGIQPSDWFSPEATAPFVCIDPQTLELLCDFVMFTEDDETDQVDTDIANNSLTGGGVKEWMSERYLYEKLNRYPALQTPGSVLETFFNNESSTTVGQFSEIDYRMSALYTIDTVTMALFQQNQGAILGLLDSLKVIDSQLLTATGNDSVALLSSRNIFLQEINGRTETGQNLMDAIQYQQSVEAGFIRLDNDDIAATDVFEVNKKQVSDVMLEMMGNGSAELSTYGIAALQSIANQCPLEGGDAVITARSLLTLTGNATMYDDDQLCASLGNRNSQAAGEMIPMEDAFAFKMFPNPAKEIVKFEWTSIVQPTKELDLVIHDGIGRQVVVKQIEAGDYTFILQTSGFGPGVYLVEIKENGKVLFSDKLVVIK